MEVTYSMFLLVFYRNLAPACYFVGEKNLGIENIGMRYFTLLKVQGKKKQIHHLLARVLKYDNCTMKESKMLSNNARIT